MREDTIRQSAVRSAVGGIRRIPLLQPLASRNFRLLWLGESVSVFGNFFHMIALAWVVLEELGSGLALGTVMMAAAIPRALFMPFGGVLADRLSPRMVMIVSNAASVVLVGLLAFLVSNHSVTLWQLYLFAVATGAAGAFFLPAMMAIIPRLVSKERLEAGNSLLQATSQLSGLAGPAVAGFVVAAVGSATAMGIDAVTFAFATAMLLLMRGITLRGRTPQEGDEPAAPMPRSGALTDLKNGLRYVWDTPAVRIMLPAIAVINFCLVGPIDVGLASLAHDHFSGEATDLGIMLSVFAGSAVLGALLAGSIKPRRRGILVILIMVIEGVGLGTLSLAQNALQASLMLGVMGAVVGFINVTMIAWLQGNTRQDMLGRVMSLVMFASMGLTPVSLALAGWLVDVNHTMMFVGAGGLVLVTCLFMATSRTIRAVD